MKYPAEIGPKSQGREANIFYLQKRTSLCDFIILAVNLNGNSVESVGLITYECKR